VSFVVGPPATHSIPFPASVLQIRPRVLPRTQDGPYLSGNSPCAQCLAIAPRVYHLSIATREIKVMLDAFLGPGHELVGVQGPWVNLPVRSDSIAGHVSEENLAGVTSPLRWLYSWLPFCHPQDTHARCCANYV
jgi:hypothetical protein